ncbi:hypothetical protein MAR_027746 [Mya arenaria]|uniref:Uncharacterized protein n=1 Tax=Mya arenaria TaxID=6604 RepID=A0ABY7EXZ7_MYAAR|nr:hypothetical protein MAR_027746 [Mya arenaria]
MDFSNRDSGKRKGALKRWKRDKSLATSRVRMLEQEKDKVFRKYRSTQHSLQRLKVRLNTGQANAEMRPNKETEKEMKDAKLDKFQRQKLKKSLLFGHVSAKEIKETKKATPMSKLKALHRVVSGKIVKKYKIIKHLSDKTGLCRHHLSRSITKNHQIRTSRSETEKVVEESYEIGEFVAAVYDGTWFVGKVNDKDENEIEIDFMEKKKQLLTLTFYVNLSLSCYRKV